MITDAKRMACGNCGHGLFRMFTLGRLDSIEGHLELAAECAECKSASIIKPMPSLLQLDFAEGAPGRLCEMTLTTGG